MNTPKIALTSYVAANNPSGAHKILQAWGVPMKSNASPVDLAMALSRLFNNNKEAMMEDLAHNHPDKQLILYTEQVYLGQHNFDSNNLQSNACGCSSCSGDCGCKKSAADGMEEFRVFQHPFDGNTKAHIPGAGPQSSRESGYSVVLFGAIFASLLIVVCKS